MAETPIHRVLLIDGSGFIFRAFHGLPPMTRPDGTPVNAVYGFITMMMKLLDNTDASHIAVIFDHARRTFRNDIYPEYKAHRPPPPDDLIVQLKLARDAARALNVIGVEMEGFEADDLIATYARQACEAGAMVTIVASDKDLMQLVNDRVVMMDAMKNRLIGPKEVMEKFGVSPGKVVDVQALAGDSSDNIPGVSGIGLKTAAQLINEYGDLDSLLARAFEIKQQKRRESLINEAGQARLSRQLAKLCSDAPVTIPLASFAAAKPDPEVIRQFLKENAFVSLLARMESRLDHGPGATKSTAAKRDYQLILTVESLKTWIAKATKAGMAAVDTETTSLDAMAASLVGISLAVELGSACYIPLGHKTAKAAAAQGSFDLGDGLEGKPGGGQGGAEAGAHIPGQIPINEVLALLKPMLEDPSVLKIGQNIKYDMLILSRRGIAISPVDDTMVLSYVLEGGLHGHGMDELARLYLQRETIKFKDVVGSGKNQITFDLAPLDQALDYAAEDADVTLALHRLLKPRLAADRMTTVYETIERPLIGVLADMEKNGVKVDAAKLKALSLDFARRMGQLEKEIHHLAGREFNVGSPKQLGEILFDEMGLQGGKKGKTGAYSTDHETLDGLAAAGFDLPQRVLDWRQLAKLKSTYADALIDQINPMTGRVHTSFAMAATSTGRLASSNPNLQNIPIRTAEGRKIRQTFIAEEGNVLLSADYSQIELRLLAHVAGIESLKLAFLDGLDIHAITASQVFGVPIKGMDPTVRRQAKAINFGIIYGISAFGLARQLNVSNSQAANYIKAYFEKYPGINDYMERTKDEAKRQGFVATLFGRKCHVPGINDKNPQMRAFAERAAINAPIQGGAADIIKLAMIQLPKALKASGLNARMLLQVHDELLFEVRKDEIEETKALVAKVMEQAAMLDVPLVVDAGHGANWDEAH